MNWNRMIWLAVALAACLAPASNAIAAGSGSMPAGIDGHAVCFYDDKSGDSFPGFVGSLSNDIRVLALGLSEGSSLGEFLLYGAATRNGSVFSGSLLAPGAESGISGFVFFVNRNKTWCGYAIEGTTVEEEVCGTWDFKECPTDDTSTPRWFER
ncbi:MAG: hypothetical protein ACKVU1_05345 [bacterium]